MEVQGRVVANPRATVTDVVQKALNLSAQLRELDNHPMEIEPALQEQLTDTLEMLECRIAATRVLFQERQPEPASMPA